MKYALIVAALCVSLAAATPPAQAAAKGPTDMQFFCTFMPLLKDCMKPATPAKMAAPAATKIAAAKPAVMPKLGIKMMSCVKAPAGKPYLLACSWK